MTVTTVLYNSADQLDAYAGAIGSAVASGLVEVIAVDNASPDQSAAELERLLPQARLIRSPVNGGFASGCNRAWPFVRTRYWLLLNPDVEADAASIARLVDWMDRHPAVGAASPRLHDSEGRPIPVARVHDSLWRPFVELLRLHKLVPEPWRSRLLLSGRAQTPATIAGWVPGAAMIVRSEVVRVAGALDDSLFMYGEDREWCWRIRRSGWLIGVCSDVVLAHVGGSSAEATWGGHERIRREVAGHLRVTCRIHGGLYAHCLAALTALALLAEAVDGRRPATARAQTRLRGLAYLRAASRPIAR